MNATINTFPPCQSMNSPRGWILAAIVLLHFGFFLALSSGMGVHLVQVLKPPAVLITPPVTPEHPPETVVPKPVNIDGPRIFVPEPVLPPTSETEPQSAIRDFVTDNPPVTTLRDAPATAAPVIVAPEIDPRIGLSEPSYPASEIRAGNTGTVLLSVYVLENGRVGKVRLDRTSGHAKLDESALREARRWRLKPGMRDGVPVAMWKQIPVTFQLMEGGRRF